MNYSKIKFLIIKLILITLLVLNFPIISDASTNYYNANEWEVFKNRTKEQIGAEYAKAINAGATYRNGKSSTYYNRVPSLKNPYSEGELTSDTLEAMTAMSNYYRWLEGVDPITSATSTSDLQAGALTRNWQFDHSISIENKPTDMSDELWNRGAKVSHNILASGYSPSGSITGWLDEGYNLTNNTWDTIGHRTALLSSSVSELKFGYAGRIAIGKIARNSNTMDLPYTAFPVPGYMPSNVLYSITSAWHIELNSNVIENKNSNNVKIIVTNLKTNESYECTKQNGKLSGSYVLAFVQPKSETNKYYSNGEKFKVEVTGLTEIATGNPITLTYTTEFFDVSNYATSTRATNVQISGDWDNLVLSSQNATTDNLNKISYILPNTVNVSTEAKRTATVRIKSDWILDENKKCWTATIDKNSFPSFLKDPDGILDSVKITYTIDDAYRNYYFHASNNNPTVGTSMNFNLWTYMRTSNTYEVYKISNLSGIISVTQRFKENEDTIYQNPTTNWYEFKLNSVKNTDTGTYFCIYYHDSEYFRSAYLAGIEDVEVKLPVATFTKEPQSRNSVYNGQFQELAIAGETNDGIIKYSLNGKDFDAKIPTAKDIQSYKVYYKIVSDNNHLDSDVKSFTSTIYKKNSDNEKPSTGGDNTTPTKTLPFKDVKRSDWFYNAVEYVYTNNIIKGYNTTTFAPNDQLTRGMMVTILHRMEGSPAVSGNTKFSDVQNSKYYYYNAVKWASDKGIVTGYDNGKFGPDDNITREQLAVILCKYAKYKGKNITQTNDLRAFSDRSKVSKYALAQMKWAVGSGVITGNKDKTLKPQGNATRAEVSAMLEKYCQRIGR